MFCKMPKWNLEQVIHFSLWHKAPLLPDCVKGMTSLSYTGCTDTHTYARAQIPTSQGGSTNTHTMADNKPTNCPAVYLAMSGFVHCKRRLRLRPACGTKGNRSRGGGQSETCVLLIMGRRVLAFILVDQGHRNRCEGGSGLWWGWVGAESRAIESDFVAEKSTRR